MHKKCKSAALGMAGPALLLLIWQLTVRYGHFDRTLFPGRVTCSKQGAK